jgi:hypothetical protein
MSQVFPAWKVQFCVFFSTVLCFDLLNNINDTDVVSVERRNLFVDEKVLLFDELNFFAIFL